MICCVSRTTDNHSVIYYVVTSAFEMVESNQDKIPPDHLHELCRVLFLCAGRAAGNSRSWLQQTFPVLTKLLADELGSLGDPTGHDWPHLIDTLKWHCVLNMAMKLAALIPGTIDKALFEALHFRSVKMFDLVLRDPVWALEDRVQGKQEGTSPITDASSEELDWERVLNDPQYVRLGVLGKGEYSGYGDPNVWRYQGLRANCIQRIEFLRHFNPFLAAGYGSLLSRYQF